MHADADAHTDAHPDADAHAHVDRIAHTHAHAAHHSDHDEDLRLHPTGGTAPLASAINFRAGIVRANNAIISLGVGGQISVQCDMPSGGTHFFFDVYGYFE